MLRVAGMVRNWSSNKDWGLKVPGRPPTPSEGAAQQYYRFGAANQQDILSFDNGTCLEFGPMDQVDEFILGYHPFSEQVALIDKSINDILVVRGRYPNGIVAQGVFADFRSSHAPISMVTFRNTDSGVYAQVPSKHCSVTNMVSVYTPITKVDVIGQALPAERGSDSRYGTTGRPPPDATHKYPRQDHPQQVSSRPAQYRPTHPRQEYHRPGQPLNLNARARRLQRRAAERSEHTPNQRTHTNHHPNHQQATRHPPRTYQNGTCNPSTVRDDFRREGGFLVNVHAYRPPDARVNGHHHGSDTLAGPTHDRIQISLTEQYTYPNQNFQHGPLPEFSHQLPSERQVFHEQFNRERATMHYPEHGYYDEPGFSQSGQVRPPPGFGYPPQFDTFSHGDEFIQPRGSADYRHQHMQDGGFYQADGHGMTDEPRVRVMPATPERGSRATTTSSVELEENDEQASEVSATTLTMSCAAERRTSSQPAFRPSNGLLSAVMSQSNLSTMSMPVRQNEAHITLNTPSRDASRPASSIGFIRATSPSFQSVSDDMSVTSASNSAGDVVGKFLQAGNLSNTIFGEQPGVISRRPSPITSRGQGLGRRLYEQSDTRGSTSNP